MSLYPNRVACWRGSMSGVAPFSPHPPLTAGRRSPLPRGRPFVLDGLLPSGVTTLEGQVRRVYVQYLEQANPLRKWVYLANLRDRNEVLSPRGGTSRRGCWH